MDKQVHNLLLKVDSEKDWEYPSDFDYIKSLKKVEELKPRLEKILGQELKIDKNVQDASFFGELCIFAKDAKRQTGVIELRYNFAIRFSSFGNLVTIHTNDIRSNLNKYPLNLVITELSKASFIYVNFEDLQSPYDGPLGVKNPNFTWWRRYFDYL